MFDPAPIKSSAEADSMATADEYAAWIVQNADKRGTPDFDTVVQAYELAKAQEAQPRGTSAAGLAGAAVRGAGPIAGGAAIGAALGAPVAGVGAIPGAIAGAGAAALAPLVGDPIVDTVNNLFGTKFTRPTEAMQNLLTRMGVPEAKTQAERIVQSTAAGAAGAGGIASAGRAVQAAATSPVTREVGRSLAAQPLAQVAGGAGAGAAGQAAQEAGGTPAGQIGASLVGGVLGARMVPSAARIPNAGLQQGVTAAEQRGIPVMTSDAFPPSTFIGQVGQRTGERIPVLGTGPVRVAQQQARVDAVKDLLRQFGADDAANVSDDVMRDLASKRSADLTKYTGLKNEVIDRLGNAGTVPVTNATQAIDNEISRLQGLKSEQYAPIIRTLEDWKNSLQGQNLRNIETLRKQVGESFSAPELSSIRSAGEKSLSSIYGPLKQDMETFIRANGETRDATKWAVANKRLSELAGELEFGTLKSVLRSGNATPEVVNKLLFSAKPSEVRQLYSSLTPAGQANARTAILARAAQNAEGTLEDGTKVFKPEQFNAALKRLQPQIGVFFKGSDLEQVEGLSRALTLTRRAAQSGVPTATGQETMPFVAGSFLQSVVGSFFGSLAVAGGVGAMARVYESAPVRNLMIKLGKAEPGSSLEEQIAKRLFATIQTQSEAIEEKAQTAAGQP
jgi:hypothetical protein